jgi:glycosyltransferase involved in cell wall biosynthesis
MAPQMKLLFLVQKEQRVILDSFYDSIARHAGDCDIRWLSSQQQANLKDYFYSEVNAQDYDRVVLFLRFKKEIRQWRFLRKLPNLVFLEHDAYQNYIENKYRGRFSRQYQRMPWVRVLSSGAYVTQRLQAENLDAVFVPKGYDQTLIQNRQRERSIELGFVGSIKSGVYQQRKQFLTQLAEREALEVVRTNSGEEYVEKLNRIRFFISADIGMGEYMIKNFEAMAAGCVLFAWRQGNGEEEALGFQDMNNMVLYSSLEECQNKLKQLRENPALADKIARAGQELVEKNYSFEETGKKVVQALEPPLRKPQDYALPLWRQLLGW